MYPPLLIDRLCIMIIHEKEIVARYSFLKLRELTKIILAY